jgi:two-component system, chemotaxis family, response regulator Rcp1
MRLLVVEDNSADARLVIEALQECPIPTQVSVVSDGLQALSYLRREGQYAGVALPDLLLLDLNLPKMDGRQALTRIKADPALAHIPVIIFTSSEAEHEVLAAYRCGASCYLVKPHNLSDYFALLQALITFWATHARLVAG